MAEDLIVEIYKTTEKFPRSELFGIVSQIRRAAVSVSANIAEGASRQHKKEYLNFLYTSRGSISEVECLLNVSFKVGYLDEETLLKLESIRQITARMIYRLIESVEKEIK